MISPATVKYGYNAKELEKGNEKVLDSIGMPDQPHAIRVTKGYSNLLLRVNAQIALIRWLRVNQEEEKGLGYYLYKAGTLKYDSVFRELSFEVSPL